MVESKKIASAKFLRQQSIRNTWRGLTKKYGYDPDFVGYIIAKYLNLNDKSFRVGYVVL